VQALVILDMQHDFVGRGPLADARPRLVRTINQLVALAREADVPVVDVRTVHAPDGSTWALNMREDDQGMAIEGSHGAEPADGLDLDGALPVCKTRDNAFFRTGLEALLREGGVTSFVLCGVSTESCIAATATDAYARDLRVTFVDGSVASAEPERHADVLAALGRQYRQPTVPLDGFAFEAAGKGTEPPRQEAR